SGEFTVDIREWNSKVFDEFPGDDSTKVTFLFLNTTDGDPKKAPEPWVQVLQLKDRRYVNLYPNQREVEAEQGKVELIKVLDTIAKAATEWKFQFRPKICFGTGICPLIKEQATWDYTAVNRDNPKMKDIVLVTKPSGDDSVKFTGNGTTEEQLKKFALYYYERLRKLLPGMSFDDGVRLDIGASGDGRLWVIEVTPCLQGIRHIFGTFFDTFQSHKFVSG
ncbi:hypothetical protein PoMZ_13584, partial [Pyricularia oryzae]